MTTENVDTSAAADATQNNAATAADTNTQAAQTTAAEGLPAGERAPETALTTQEPDGGARGKWPEDWRDQFAKGDEKALKLFSRYASPEAMAEALIEANKVISKHKAAPQKPAKDATPEELKAYRESQGVPEKPDGYFDKLPGGLVVGDDDRPLFDSFAAIMHDDNIPAGTVHKVIDWYYKKIVEDGEQQRYNADKEARLSTEDELRQEYGPEYRAHINGIQNLLNSLPGEAGQILASAQTADGISLFNNPAVVRAMVHLVNEVNPTASVIPGGTSISSIDDRLKAIADLQSKDPKAYFTDAIQQEELKLIQAKEKLQARA